MKGWMMSEASISQNKFTEGKAFQIMQRLGRSFMLPISVLPAAALLLRLGQDDMLGKDGLNLGMFADIIGAAGGALFNNLGFLFAVGVAVGYAKKADGSTGLAAVVGYLVYMNVLDVMAPHVMGESPSLDTPHPIDYQVLGGIVIGLITALLYERFYRIKLPPYLAFFGGRRFVPMITAITSMIVAVIMAYPYPAFESGLNAVSTWVSHHVVIGGFVFGMANRLLLTFGLHHLLNNIPWFQLGSYTYQGQVYHGDIARFLHHDPTAGTFMTGFFPIMMFALPGAALAIWHSADKENRAAIGGLMTSVALTAFITGVTEPLEFSFMFVAYPLYLFHAFMTGTSLALTNALGIHDGFGFSAGAIDYTLNLGIATKPLLLIPIGLVYAAIYYVVFRWAIAKFDFATPGRTKKDLRESQETIKKQPVANDMKKVGSQKATNTKEVTKNNGAGNVRAETKNLKADNVDATNDQTVEKSEHHGESLKERLHHLTDKKHEDKK
ncbi:MAG: PTS transporter subunit EIIC [Micrococcaceae bacterium]